MTEDRQALLEHYRQSRAELLDAIEGLTDEQLSDPSLDGWSVKDHLAHLAAWDEIRASEVLRISAGFDSLWRMTGEQDAQYNALAYDLRRGISPAQARWELESARARFMEALTSADERALDPSLYGEAGLNSGHELEHAQWIKRWRESRGI